MFFKLSCWDNCNLNSSDTKTLVWTDRVFMWWADRKYCVCYLDCWYLGWWRWAASSQVTQGDQWPAPGPGPSHQSLAIIHPQPPAPGLMRCGARTEFVNHILVTARTTLISTQLKTCLHRSLIYWVTIKKYCCGFICGFGLLVGLQL